MQKKLTFKTRYQVTEFVLNCPRKLAAVRPNTESVLGQFCYCKISGSNWHLYSRHLRTAARELSASKTLI